MSEAKPKKVKLDTFSTLEGSRIDVAEFNRQLPFLVKRNYIISTKSQPRVGGRHSHKALWQFFVCTSGSFTIEFRRDEQVETITLTDPSEGVLVCPGWWREYRLEAHSSVSVLASEVYQEQDYIRAEQFDELPQDSAITQVPFVALDRENASLSTAFNQAFEQELTHNQWILGQAVTEFEQGFADYCGVEYAIGCGNGLDALTIALIAAGVGSGDEVILPANTFIATALAVSRLGAIPRFTECETMTGAMSLASLTEHINAKTKAIIVVHLYGLVFDIKPILALAKEHDLFVLEDAAQAHGARCEQGVAGGLGHAAAFSFYPSKNLGALGDGGCITTNDKALSDRVRALANYGSTGKYQYEMAGINSRLDTIQAAFLTKKLPHLDTWNKQRQKLYHLYYQALNLLPEIAMISPETPLASVWHICPIYLPNKATRIELQAFLAERNIATSIHYPDALHKTPPFEQPDLQLPVAEANAERELSLPICPFITEDEVRYVCAAINQFFADR